MRTRNRRRRRLIRQHLRELQQALAQGFSRLSSSKGDSERATPEFRHDGLSVGLDDIQARIRGAGYQ